MATCDGYSYPSTLMRDGQCVINLYLAPLTALANLFQYGLKKKEDEMSLSPALMSEGRHGSICSRASFSIGDGRGSHGGSCSPNPSSIGGSRAMLLQVRAAARNIDSVSLCLSLRLRVCLSLPLSVSVSVCRFASVSSQSLFLHV